MEKDNYEVKNEDSENRLVLKTLAVLQTAILSDTAKELLDTVAKKPSKTITKRAFNTYIYNEDGRHEEVQVQVTVTRNNFMKVFEEKIS